MRLLLENTAACIIAFNNSSNFHHLFILLMLYFWRWGLIWSMGDLTPGRPVLPPDHGTCRTASHHACHGAAHVLFPGVLQFPAQKRAKELTSMLLLPMDRCLVCPSSAFYLPPFCPIALAAWHLPGGTPASANLNNGLSISPGGSKGAQSFSPWKVPEEWFIQAPALLYLKVKNCSKKNLALWDTYIAPLPTSLWAPLKSPLIWCIFTTPLQDKGDIIILVLQMESQGTGRALLPNHFSFISELTSGGAWLYLSQRSALWTAGLTWRLMKDVKLPQKQQTKFGWLHHYGSFCTNVGATAETLNMQELFTNLKLVHFKSDVVSLYSWATVINIGENRLHTSGR